MRGKSSRGFLSLLYLRILMADSPVLISQLFFPGRQTLYILRCQVDSLQGVLLFLDFSNPIQYLVTGYAFSPEPYSFVK